MKSYSFIARVFTTVWKINKIYVVYLVINAILSGTLPLVSAYLLKNVIDIVTAANSGKLDTIILMIGLIVLIDLLVLIMNKIGSTFVPIVVMRISKKITDDIYEKASRIKYSLYESPEFYDKFEVICKEKDGFSNVLRYILSIFSGVISLSMAIPVLLGYSWIIGALILVINIPVCFIQVKIKRRNFDFFIRNNPTNRFLGALGNILSNKAFAKEIRAYNIFSWIINKHTDTHNKLLQENKSLLAEQSKLVFISSLIKTLFNGAIYIILSISVLFGKLTIGVFSLCISYVQKVDSSLSSIVSNSIELYNKSFYLNSLFEFLDETALLQYEEKNLLPEKKAFEIVFQNVSFQYPNQERLALDNVSFRISACEKVALVGLNGAGKSTLVKLLLKYYEPSSGTIYVNGIDIQKYNNIEYYQLIGAMLQDYAIYPFSLKENIFMANIDKNEAERKLTHFSNTWFNSLISKMPYGLDTVLLPFFDKKGIQLSEGESQKVALQRALLREKAQLFILDEPSSSLDAKAECEIFEELLKRTQDKTCIFISHRLSSCTIADRVIFLEDGKVVENGKHTDLVSRNNKYSELFYMQAQKYKEGL